MLGFACNPLPSNEELIEMIHIKYACAGAHSIDLSLRIWGFPLPFEAIRASIATCLRCGENATFRRTSVVTPSISVLEHAAPIKDVLVFDGAEFPTVSHRGNRTFLVAKLVKCGTYFVRPGGRSFAADQIIKIINALEIPIVACYSDRSRDFSRVQTYCLRKGIAYNPSHIGRDEYKGYQESAVSTAKAVMEWF